MQHYLLNSKIPRPIEMFMKIGLFLGILALIFHISRMAVKDYFTFIDKDMGYLSTIFSAFISLMGTVSVAVLTILFVQKEQLDISKSQKSLARHQSLRNFEEDLKKLLSSSCVKKGDEILEFRRVLDDECWTYNEDFETIMVDNKTHPPLSKTEKGLDKTQNWVLIKVNKQQEYYITSQALQETILLFRRIHRAYSDDVLIAQDLLNFWRFLLPFGYANRLFFFKNYFMHESEVSAIVEVISEILECSIKENWPAPALYFYKCSEGNMARDREIILNYNKDIMYKLEKYILKLKTNGIYEEK